MVDEYHLKHFALHGLAQTEQLTGAYLMACLWKHLCRLGGHRLCDKRASVRACRLHTQHKRTAAALPGSNQNTSRVQEEHDVALALLYPMSHICDTKKAASSLS